MKVQVKKLHTDAKIPTYAHGNDAGFDLFTIEAVTLGPGEHAQIKTGLAIELPAGYAGLIWDKSGLSHKNGLKVLGGVFDAGYQGEWLIGMINLSNEEYTFAKGDKIAQALIQLVEQAVFEETDSFKETDRGTSGFGSTGK